MAREGTCGFHQCRNGVQGRPTARIEEYQLPGQPWRKGSCFSSFNIKIKIANANLRRLGLLDEQEQVNAWCGPVLILQLTSIRQKFLAAGFVPVRNLWNFCKMTLTNHSTSPVLLNSKVGKSKSMAMISVAWDLPPSEGVWPWCPKIAPFSSEPYAKICG